MINEKLVILDNTNFDDIISGSESPVLVDFWATWCGPCKALAPIIDRIADDYGDRIKVCKLDVDANGDIVEQFNIMGVPTVILFRGGEATDTFVGVKSEQEYRSAIDRLL